MLPRALHAAQTASPLARGGRTRQFLAVGHGARLVARMVSLGAESKQCERKQRGHGRSADGVHLSSQRTLARMTSTAIAASSPRNRANRIRDVKQAIVRSKSDPP